MVGLRAAVCLEIASVIEMGKLLEPLMVRLMGSHLVNSRVILSEAVTVRLMVKLTVNSLV